MSQAKKNIFDQYPEYEATIGIETHVQLKTYSKIFCSCLNKFGTDPNTNICEICAGHPGTLPVLNKKVVDFAIMLGLATDCIIRDRCNFARKHYFYPDLPKNYQITQDKTPICENGHLPIQTANNEEKIIRIARIHMEEDAGKNIHSRTGAGLVDLNRAGTPLLEIVSQPDISDSDEAKSYLTRLHSLVRYLNISDANMEEGSFRGDVNISIKKKIDYKFGTKVELKNVNSFKFIVQAINYEINRQMNLILNEEQKNIKQETRLWDNKNSRSVSMRTKESAQDYHYFPDPDLPELHVNQQWINQIKSHIPELPHQKYKRLQSEYGLSPYEAEIIVGEKTLADFFEKAAKKCDNFKSICNWILRDFLGYLKEHKIELEKSKIFSQHIAELVIEIDKGSINNKIAKEVFVDMAVSGKMPAKIIQEKGLKQIGSTEELEVIVLDIIKQNPNNVKKYKSGKDRIFGFFIGQAMKATGGKGSPKILTELFKKHLG
jgi:aspartyl-tRNA(Asn)/glutamyl-tRNA(Gln) amidotransferase subunit B